jgi:hypothetical protein
MNARDIVTALRTKDYHAANEGFAQVMQAKLADRLAVEKRIVATQAINENDAWDDDNPYGHTDSDSFIVMCAVSGGVTGSRSAPAKSDGKVIYFPTREKAEAYVTKAYAGRSGYGPAQYRYWVEPAGLHEAAHALGTLVRCKKCNAWVDLAFGADEPAAHQDAAGTKDDPRSPGDHDDICDACDYGGEGNWFPGTVGTHYAGKRLKEATIPAFEVQRVFDEIGDVEETELLCGVTGLRVNENGSVVSYVTEGVQVRMYDYEHPDAEGKFRDIVAKCPKCSAVYPMSALTGLSHMGGMQCPDCGVDVKAGSRYGTFQWDDVNDPNVATYLGD